MCVESCILIKHSKSHCSKYPQWIHVPFHVMKCAMGPCHVSSHSQKYALPGGKIKCSFQSLEFTLEEWELAWLILF